jgi:hypothetical protein
MFLSLLFLLVSNKLICIISEKDFVGFFEDKKKSFKAKRDGKMGEMRCMVVRLISACVSRRRTAVRLYGVSRFPLRWVMGVRVWG